MCVFLGIITHRRCSSSPSYLLRSKVTRAALIWDCRVAENGEWTVEEITWKGEINISAALPVCADHQERLFSSRQNVGSLTLLTLFPINTSFHMSATANDAAVSGEHLEGTIFSLCWTSNKEKSADDCSRAFQVHRWHTSSCTFLSQMYADVCFCVAKKVEFFE